ncbi:glycine--tRNA ligase [Nanoarchaeota archaeon]
MAESEHLKELLAYLGTKGFIWGPEPEIYGGLAGFYSYGPLGKLLKNNVEDAIRKVFQRNHMFEMECPTVMPANVWKASGHLGGFTDPLIKCSKCKSDFRVDKLIEEENPDLVVGVTKDEELLKIVKDEGLKCPNCKGAFDEKIMQHSLMMKTTIGVDTEAYNRPETATTTYLPFLRYLEFFRDKFPFGVFQIGKAYRNEISPRQNVLRGREFTQAEGQIFIFEEQKNDYEKFEEVSGEKLPLWTEEQQKGREEPKMVALSEAIEKKLIKTKAYAWTLHLTWELFRNMGIPAERIRFRQHHSDEKAFYADDAWDLEVKLESYGWYEMCGVHDRTSYDLGQHGKHSGKELVARNSKNEKEAPHVLEIAFGTDRPTFALLDIFYEKKSKDEGKTVFKIPYHLAPVKVAVLPLVNKEGIPELAQKVHAELSQDFLVVYDKSASIGKRYLRNDEIGTPYCLTVDFESLKDGDVTIRDRDSTEQVRVKIDDLNEVLGKLINGKMKFEELK